MEEKGFLILYGSHTGQAEAISRQLMDRVHSLGLRARVCGMQQAEVGLGDWRRGRMMHVVEME